MTQRSRRQTEWPELLRIEPKIYHFSALQNVSVGVWVGQATLPAVQGLVAINREMNKRFPEGHSSIGIVLDKVAAPTPEARELLARLFAAGSTLSCSATVVEGTGFWASGLRSMINNTHRAAAGTVRLRVHGTIDEVLAWLPDEHAKCTGVKLDPVAMKQALIERRALAIEAAMNA